jgi:hypothetical protein
MKANDPNDFFWQWPLLAVIGIVAAIRLYQLLFTEECCT